jgi:predicted ATP-dependent serine protease
LNLNYSETNFTKVEDVIIPDNYYTRVKTNNKIIDDLFSGGLIPGTTFSLFSKQGYGKSSLALTYLEMLGLQGYRVGICSTEETIQQLSFTCKRLNIKNIEIANISDVDTIADKLYDYDVVVVDSFQGLTHPKYDGHVRTIEKYAVEKLVSTAKSTDTILGIILHATKMGTEKGGTIVMHSVDMNMGIDKIKGAVESSRKITITKNRFGRNNELDCYLNETGYDFNTPVTILEDNKEPKRERKEVTWQRILDMKVPITLANVTKLLDNNSTKAYFVLREMSLNNMLIKNGRGQEAVFNKN